MRYQFRIKKRLLFLAQHVAERQGVSTSRLIRKAILTLSLLC